MGEGGMVRCTAAELACDARRSHVCRLTVPFSLPGAATTHYSAAIQTSEVRVELAIQHRDQANMVTASSGTGGPQAASLRPAVDLRGFRTSSAE